MNLLKTIAAVIVVGTSIGCQSTKRFIPLASSVNRTEPTAPSAASSDVAPPASIAGVESAAKEVTESDPLKGYYPEDYSSKSVAAEPIDTQASGFVSSGGSSVPRTGSFSSGPPTGCSGGCCPH